MHLCLFKNYLDPLNIILRVTFMTYLVASCDLSSSVLHPLVEILFGPQTTIFFFSKLTNLIIPGDSDDDGDDHGSRNLSGSPSKKERFFWQYNVQAKGPKGQRLVMKAKMEDPHVLNEVTDPVFSPDCAVRGIKHSGKARKGDGNDLTPNARKLYNIGKELDKLARIINDMTPVSELPFNVRPKTRKEKNKLASRACRLKKKAQHEANKIKLQGLETEHSK